MGRARDHRNCEAHGDLMNNTRVLSVRRTASALVCAVALVPLAACQENGGAAPAGDTKPSQSADAGTDAKPNGVEKLSAKEIYSKATQANADAGSFRQRATSEASKTDLLVSATECVGTVEKPELGSWEIIRKGDDAWAKVDAKVASWAKANGAEIPVGKWMHGTPTQPMLKNFISYCHPEQFTAPDKASSNPVKGQVVDLDGTSVVPIVNKVDASNSITYYVAATGPSNLLKREIKGGDDNAQNIVFSDFGKPVGAKAPSGEVVKAPSV